MNDLFTPSGSLNRLEIQREGDADGIVLRLTGELDLETAPKLDAEVREASATNPKRLLVDLDRVEFMDSTGLASIMRAKRAADSNGHMLTVRSGTSQVQRLFDLTGMRDRLTFED